MKMIKPWLIVSVEKPTIEQKNKHPNRALYKKATIVHTFDPLEFPIGAVFMMGKEQGELINFFGEPMTKISSTALYSKL